jgi:hypothetical protein
MRAWTGDERRPFVKAAESHRWAAVKMLMASTACDAVRYSAFRGLTST